MDARKPAYGSCGLVIVIPVMPRRSTALRIRERVARGDARRMTCARAAPSGWWFRSRATRGLQMYPGVRFVARGVGVRSLTPTGYDSAWEGILPAAEHLAVLGVDAVMVIGTSLTFYRGADAHEELMAKLRAATGRPVSTISHAVGARLRSF